MSLMNEPSPYTETSHQKEVGILEGRVAVAAVEEGPVKPLPQDQESLATTVAETGIQKPSAGKSTLSSDPPI